MTWNRVELLNVKFYLNSVLIFYQGVAHGMCMHQDRKRWRTNPGPLINSVNFGETSVLNGSA